MGRSSVSWTKNYMPRWHISVFDIILQLLLSQKLVYLTIYTYLELGKNIIFTCLLLPPSQNKWLNWPWALSQNKWLLCFTALIQVVSLDHQWWNHNVIWEEVALPAPICVSLNVALYNYFLHTLSSSQSCSIEGSKRHYSTTDLKMMIF
jgi:hypothetical protein